MSTSWPTPDPRRRLPSAPSLAMAAVVPAQAGPTVRQDVWAGLLTAVVTVLAGAPVGLLWAAVAPRVQVAVTGADVQLVEPASSAFIAGDGAFLAAVAVAGLLGGVVAWRLGRKHGPAVVVSLTLAGVVAAYVAMVVGQQVGAEQVQQAVMSGQQGVLELNLRLRAQEALVGWPVGALVGYVGASLLRGR